MKQIEKAVEVICEKGCKSVNHIRAQIERGETVQELMNLSVYEQRQVKHELDEIMSVYENKKRCTVTAI